MKRFANLGHDLPSVLRLGFATRGNTSPASEDLLHALDRGVNYWNWCGHDDGMSLAVGELGAKRSEVVVATQLSAVGWSRDAMWRELESALKLLKTDWLDVVTLYYVETNGEWEQINSSNGSLVALNQAKEQGLLRSIGLTTHQRELAATWAKTGDLDLIMTRYNAAHRGAETSLFPVTDHLKIPVVAFTCLRWGALIEPTAMDPIGFKPPCAADCYRFVLSNPSVGVALMAPNDRRELQHNLAILDAWKPLSKSESSKLREHGDRVRATAGAFY